ncbi:MAG: substrate-binding domain-containing protein [candidate division FCPU426 bacterium]
MRFIQSVLTGCFFMVAVLAQPVLSAKADDLIYEGSVPIGEYIIVEAGKAFKEKYGVNFDAIYTSGTDVALKSLQENKCDVAGIARSLTPEEKSSKFYFQIIGYDTLAVFVNEKNRVEGLTTEQLRRIFTGAVRNWREVGGADLPIRKVVDGTPGRTLNNEFKKLALNSEEYFDVEMTANPREHLLQVTTDVAVITFDSLPFKPEGAKILEIDGHEATDKNVRWGVYPLKRPLHLMCKGQPRGNVKKFMRFMLTPEGQAIVGKGFVRVK